MTRVQILATVAGILLPISGQSLAAHQPRHTSSTHLRGAVEENRGAVTSPYGLPRFGNPVRAGEQRYLSGLYLDQPEEWDDPYRFFRW